MFNNHISILNPHYTLFPRCVISSKSNFVFYSFSFFIVVKEQLSPFSPHLGHLPHPSKTPTLETTPWLCPCSFIHVFEGTFPDFPHYPESHSPLVTVRLFFNSIFWLYFTCCFFVDEVRSYGICPLLPGLFHLA